MPAGKCEDSWRGPELVGSIQVRQMQCRLICVECTEKAVSYVEHCTVNGEPFDEFTVSVPFQSSKSVITWVGCECCKKIPSLNGLGTCVRFCGV